MVEFFFGVALSPQANVLVVSPHSGYRSTVYTNQTRENVYPQLNCYSCKTGFSRFTTRKRNLMSSIFVLYNEEKHSEFDTMVQEMLYMRKSVNAAENVFDTVWHASPAVVVVDT